MLLLVFAVAAANAQSEVKIKRISSPKQKVHNAFSKHKRYNGYKVKHKRKHGRKTKGEFKNNGVEIKSHSVVMWREELVA